MNQDSSQSALFSPRTAVAVVIANMVGTGIFTSLGFQLLEIQSGFVIMMLWLVGGLTALCGALTYAELGAHLPRSGGEYHFLSELYHPGLGFVSGWVSATVGFAAPTALAAITFGKYLSSVFPMVDPTIAALFLVVTLVMGHCFSRESSAGLQTSFTMLKVLIIIGFCMGAFYMGPHSVEVVFFPVREDLELVLGGAFAVSLIYVNYAYTGWNAATYLSSELKNPVKSLPGVLVGGTLIVMVLYLMLNYTFLSVAPVSAMTGKIEIGFIAAEYAFGETGARLMGLILALLLISTVSAMVMAGPRVLQVIGEDYRFFSWLGKNHSSGIPVRAIIIQALMTLILVGTASFEAILIFSGFTLAMNSLLTVASVFILRRRRQSHTKLFRVPLYPLTPLIFITLTIWTLFYILTTRPMEGLAGVALLLAGGVFYALSTSKLVR